MARSSSRVSFHHGIQREPHRGSSGRGFLERTTVTDVTAVPVAAEWQQTACILCECNCGVEIRLGGDGRTFERVRGDKAHPASKGYTCEKA
jgi:anaerobic selenocysteine-containing dehydrogenase